MLTAAAFGILAGLGGYTFFYAEGTSYFSNDPRACRNCHIMRDPFDSWNRSSHHAAAACNECHTPKSPAGKYATKAANGWNHSAAFTLENFPEPIQIRPSNEKIAHANCVRCHEGMVSRMRSYAGETIDCTHCHGNVGHSARY